MENLEVLEMIKNNESSNIEKFVEKLYKSSFYIAFDGNRVISLDSNEENYLPLFSSKEELKDIKYTRLDEVSFEVIIRDFSSNFSRFVINPYSLDYVMDDAFLDVIRNERYYSKGENKLFTNNLIVVCGKPGTYKSSIASLIASSLGEEIYYFNLAGDNQVLAPNVKEYTNKVSFEEIKRILKKYSKVVIDYIELLDLTNDDLLELKSIVSGTDKFLVLVSNSKDINKFNNIADAIINVSK